MLNMVSIVNDGETMNDEDNLNPFPFVEIERRAHKRNIQEFIYSIK